MHDLEKAKNFYHKHLAENPDFDHHLIMKWLEKMPDSFAETMYEEEYGYHIHNEELYNKAVSYFKNPDGTTGAHWSINAISNKANMDFTKLPYTLYDFAYVVNMLYSDYGDVLLDANYYIEMAKKYLTDSDYYGKASERAYCDAMKRIKYFK